MNEKQICSDLRREFGKMGLALIVYYGIMNAMVMLVSAVQGVMFALDQSFSGNVDTMTDSMMDSLTDSILSNGWGYILATAAGALILLLWKKKRFCFVEIWETGKPMRFGNFIMLLCLFISGQAVFQLLASVMEWFFNLFGMSVMESIESASVTGDTLSMFLYMSLLAPIFEEILFRGLILRSFAPYGKKFAILSSAFLFGIFHGNIVQSPFAFVIGLILGYVTIEYSIGWAMVLHMINNLLLGDSLMRIARILPAGIGDLIFLVIIWGCALAAIVIVILKRRQIRDYFKRGKIHPLCLKSFFTSPGILVLTGMMLSNILLVLLMQMLM